MSRRHSNRELRRRRLNIRSNQRANARARGNALAVNLFSVNDGQRRR
ncbi:hypothetical protein ACT3XG_13265 [Paenibacillus polymyxa]|jgi:hypothetical protein|uniref:Uncharacterized protein n=1 Tax=Paenibacillus polymyxa TaxID=1406 RepID=A0A378XYS5_PAEPO|nr:MULTISPECIES: hypothetical protein [Paenibacillus]AHM66374.1 hypothetical protein PPSQR21_027320 [Paenibacillus polymyxa SQR-21]AUS27017.1 hypothetical protein C1A50_2850 [Paenibacillus polymyxa]KAF6581941.1 hypothetical protein G9G57_19995 [Paenibacillus sp. EKM211P]KAF6616348.1 hypothetical protein HFE00_15290 [Paenibacillus sp. EKM101P]KAF6623647.1 hypothetical protein HFE03_08385 [Paenibacillus sp. EKM102P]